MYYSLPRVHTRADTCNEGFTSRGGRNVDASQDQSSIGAHPSVGGNEMRDSIGTEPVWLAQSMMEGSPQDEYAQLQAMAQQQNATAASVEATRAATVAAAAAQVAVCAQAGGCTAGMCNDLTPGSGPTFSPHAAMMQVHHSSSGSLSERAMAASSPRLLDASCREGSFAGGTPVWLHGENFSHDLHVRFGGAAANAVNVISHNLIKCQAPSFAPLGSQSRHEVAITLVVASTNAPVSGTIPFAYVQGASAATDTVDVMRVAPELLQRLLHSLERAQAAAAATAALPEAASLDASISAELGLSAFAAMDEHGFSLTEYATELRHSLGEVAGHGQSAGKCQGAQSAYACVICSLPSDDSTLAHSMWCRCFSQTPQSCSCSLAILQQL